MIAIEKGAVMPKLLTILLLLTTVAFGQSTRKTTNHPDYVPNEKTAERIAEAVLIGQFGEQRVDAQLPFEQ